MFEKLNSHDDSKSAAEQSEESAQKEPEMFENTESEENFEIPAFLRRQKN